MVGAVLSLFLLVTKRLYGKEWEWSIGQIKTCRKKQHVKIDDIKEMSDLICGKAAVGGNYNSTRDSTLLEKYLTIDCSVNEYLVTIMNMIINFVTEFLYQRFVVFRDSIDSNTKE